MTKLTGTRLDSGKATGRSTVSSAQMISDIDQEMGLDRMSMDTGVSAWSLCTGEIMSIDYETLRAKVKLRSGTREDFPKDGVPLTFAGGGRRHFMGAMPMVGDFCVIGWSSSNSDGTASGKFPRILAYFPPPGWMGRDWLPAQDFSPMEMPHGLEGVDRYVEGLAGRVRFKLRHAEPGNIVASSAQGADLVLDESVTLANRRGNEIRLRDQDQALVMRSVNQFQAMSGARVYAGQVQRDARLLPVQMFDDGVFWDADELAGGSQGNLVSPYGAGRLLPASPFRRTPDGTTGEISEDADFARLPGNERFESNVDPFSFLTFGSFISEDGTRTQVMDGAANAGGKAFYRVGYTGSTQGPLRSVQNAALNPQAKSLSEYRIEVAHTSNGLLPVTEQTDGFDAERLPSSPDGQTNNKTFVEVVYGTVIGNDPFSGQATYGLPLAPKIGSTPQLESGIGKPLLDHAATLFKVNPLTGGTPTWFSVNKSGKAFANFPQGLEASISGQTFSFGTQGTQIHSAGVLSLRGNPTGSPPPPFGVDISSQNGAVRIYGGQRASMGVAGSENPSSQEDGPDVYIEGRNNVLLQSGSKVTINAPTFDLSNVRQIEMSGQNSIAMAAGELFEGASNTVRLGSQETMRFSSTGRSPLSDPAFQHTLTCNPGTTYVPFTPSYVVEQPTGGSYNFSTSMGNWMTNVLVGNQTYNSLTGMVSNVSMGGANISTVGPAGATTNVGVGAYTASALAGPATVTSSVSANLISTGGPSVVRSSSALLLGAPTPVPGPLVTGMCLDPLFGVPMMTLTLCDSGAVRTP